MEMFVALSIMAASVMAFGAIFRRMGFSRFTGVLMIVPVVNLIWLLFVATNRWPIEHELAERPEVEPEQRGQEDHLTLMFRRAESFEQRGDYVEALKQFEILAEELDGRPGSSLARHCAKRLRERLGPT